MSAIENPYAFPHIEVGNYEQHHSGMSLRDWFAGQALAGIMANPIRWEQIAADYRDGKKTYEQCSASNAVKAYSVADAMLEARAKAQAIVVGGVE